MKIGVVVAADGEGEVAEGMGFEPMNPLLTG